mmetsp:Transcript_9361/g.29844  ORF Transcript_9361/g.29844 Transcript_9361/m.29844 type:complete len:131 (-) Transcript_9361:19-411(-)
MLLLLLLFCPPPPSLALTQFTVRRRPRTAARLDASSQDGLPLSPAPVHRTFVPVCTYPAPPPAMAPLRFGTSSGHPRSSSSQDPSLRRRNRDWPRSPTRERETCVVVDAHSSRPCMRWRAGTNNKPCNHG